MKKKNLAQSAFFNPRALLGFALFLFGVALAFFAFNSVTGTSAKAQGTSLNQTQKALPAALPLRDMRPVSAVRTRPLREIPPINPLEAPGHDHPEPMQPNPPTKGGGIDTARQGKIVSSVSAPNPTGLSFDAVGVGLAGFAPASNPPDVEGRVGATQYVQWNNTSFAVFDKKTGALLYGPAAGNTLFQSLGGVCATHNDGDPVVSYDILAGRWILSQFVVGGPAGSFSHQCIAVSATSDATGQYYTYDFLTDANNFIDYPKTGVWPDGYYMSAHVFNSAGTSYLAGRVYVFEREKMIAGLPARQLSSNLSSATGTQYGFLPADLDSLTPPPVGEASFILGPDPSNLGLTDSTRVAVTWGSTPTITLTSSTIATTPYATAYCVSGGRACVPQKGQTNANGLDNLNSHFMYRLAYRNNGTQDAPQESLLANITVAGTPATHDAVRWYEFRNAGSSTTTPTVYQQSTFDPDTTYRWMGSIAMDKDQNMALGYSTSSTAIYPSISITGRLGTDPVNTMGAEAQVFAGSGSQGAGAGNRWGDYTSMTIDPIDQCTFYYTNEYLKTTGTFNWSTRVATYRFPSCVDAAAFGTLTGTVTSADTGVPISGVLVTLSNGYAGTTNSSGVYTILVPAGTYTATATDPARNCSTGTPSNTPVTVNVSGTTTQDFVITGGSKLEANGYTINDTPNGNGNGIVNRYECFNLNANLKNNGCADETAISATLTTTTPNVTITQPNSNYPDLAIDASGNNNAPFQVSTSSSFVCGTNIDFTLNLTYAGGSKTVTFSVPTCSGGADQTIPPSSISTTDPSQPDRLGRNGIPSPCSGKACPGPINTAGTRNYKTFTFTNTSGVARCFTATINAALNGGGDIQSAAYQNMYTPPVAQGDPQGNLCLNYLGDSGISGLGTTVSTVSYSFTVAPQSNFVIVVNTANGGTNSSVFSGTISGFVDDTPGPGPCPTGAVPNLVSAASRLTHGSAGTFDIAMPLTGPTGVEDRQAGTYNIVLTFDQAVTSGMVAVTSGTATVGAPVFSGNTMIVPLTGITDPEVVGLTLTTVNGLATSAAINLGFLVGDVNADRFTNGGDTVLVRGDSGADVNGSNFRADVNLDGFINGGDTAIVRGKSGNSLP